MTALSRRLKFWRHGDIQGTRLGIVYRRTYWGMWQDTIHKRLDRTR